MPFLEGRARLISDLGTRLSGFKSVAPVAFVRRAGTAAAAMYREIVTLDHRGGARTIGDSLTDYAGRLTDLPGVFGAFEDRYCEPVMLIDYDAARAGGGGNARAPVTRAQVC